MVQGKLPFEGPPVPPAARSVPRALSASEALLLAHRGVEALGTLCVEGELTGVKLAASGHAYFSLRDQDAALPAAMWRSALSRARVRLADGVLVRCFGKFGVFAAQGRLQFYVDRVEAAGLGDLLARLERLKEQLRAEGLFELQRKRPLPSWPRTIGVVTSSQGAVIHDITKVVRRRCPARILLAAASVQGPHAARELTAALESLQRVSGIDVIIVARGGGSVEDLMAFNDEGLARAIASSKVPVISAVGHEVDVTICDLVADRRAATPSQAAELAIGERDVTLRELAQLTARIENALMRRVLGQRRRLDEARHRIASLGRALSKDLRTRNTAAGRELEAAFTRHLEDRRARLEALSARIQTQDPAGTLHRKRARVHELESRMVLAFQRRCARARLRLGRTAASLHALSPLAVLGRGYALAHGSRGQLLKSIRDVTLREEITVRLADGLVLAGTTRVLSLEEARADSLGEGGQGPTLHSDPSAPRTPRAQDKD